MIPPCLTLSILRYRLRIKWSNQGKGMRTPTPRCSSYRKGSLLVALDYGCYLSYKPGYISVMCKVKFLLMVNSHHHHHVVPPARISLTLSRHFSLSFIAFGRSSGLHPYPHIAALCMFELVVLLLLGHMRGP